MDDSDSLSDLELETPPKMTFDEAKTQIFREPGLIKEKKELLKAMYYYCKDSKPIISEFIFHSEKAFKNYKVLVLAHDHFFCTRILQQ